MAVSKESCNCMKESDKLLEKIRLNSLHRTPEERKTTVDKLRKAIEYLNTKLSTVEGK